ncbi:DUF4192 domain-containing protein [Micrococcus antarcticus]|uniref:DUF4192 family protein n=1 Tax=Micrococcus antarcticus TaxID=86171 RepID=UPI00384DF622
MLTDPAGLICAVPSILGYAPSPGDAVACYLSDRGRVLLAARVALADLADPRALETMTAAAEPEEVTGVAVVGYGMHPYRALMLARAIAGPEDERCSVADVLLVLEDAWRAADEPSRGGPIDEVRDHPEAVRLALAGCAPSRSRAEHAAHLEPGAELDPDAAGDATDALLSLTDGHAPVDALAHTTSPGARAALVALPTVLEHVLGTIERTNAGQVLADWAAVVRAVPASIAAGPLTVAAAAAFASGDWTSCRVALGHLLGSPYVHPVVRWMASTTDAPGHPDDWTVWKAQHLSNDHLTTADH